MCEYLQICSAVCENLTNTYCILGRSYHTFLKISSPMTAYDVDMILMGTTH